MGALPKPRLPDGPARALFDALHDLHHQAGWPSLRDMAREVGCSHTTVSGAFAGPKVPRWGLLELIVETLGGDVERFHQLWLATSAGAPPPAQTLPATAEVPRQLPMDVAGFTGRTDQVAGLDRLLVDPAVPTGPVVISAVSGTAGVGKTALAVHWAHRVADRFPDGQLYVNLRGYDPERPMAPTEALEGFLRALQPDGAAIPPDLAGRAARFRTLLTDQRMLVLLDNAHSAAQVRDLLPGTGSCLVLVTSRDTLPGLVVRHGAVRVNLDLLSLDEAVDLLRTLLRERVDAEPVPAVALAQRCARLPLALRIAAELAVTRPRTSLADLVAELGDESRQLDLLAAGDDEYTAVRTVFSWSCRNLQPAEDRLFQLLGRHPCRTLDDYAVAALSGTDRAGAHRLLDPLCRGHLVEQDTAGRFGMHDLLRTYASEKSTELPDAQEALARLADYYVQTARLATTGIPSTVLAPALDSPAASREWLDRERAHLLAIAPGRARELSMILAGYLDTGGHYADGVTLHSLALKEAAGDPKSEAVALNFLGVVRRRLGDYATATEHHNAALELCRKLGDQAGQASSLHGLGVLSWRSGHNTEARDRFEEALALFTAIGDRVMEGIVTYGLGTVHLQLGAYRESVDLHLRALEIHRETGNRLGESRTLNNLGNAYERLGRLGEALDHFRRSLQLNTEIGNQLGVAVAHTNLGGAYTRLGEYEPALANYQAAAPIYAAAGYRVGDVDTLSGLGLLYLRFDRYEEALDHLRRAVAASQAIGELDVQARAFVGIGDTLRALGRFDEAQQQYEEALGRVAETGDRYEHARALVGLAHLHKNEPALARTHWENALALYIDLDLPEAAEIKARLGRVEQCAD